jgi:hypothetical protein
VLAQVRTGLVGELPAGRTAVGAGAGVGAGVGVGVGVGVGGSTFTNSCVCWPASSMVSVTVLFGGVGAMYPGGAAVSVKVHSVPTGPFTVMTPRLPVRTVLVNDPSSVESRVTVETPPGGVIVPFVGALRMVSGRKVPGETSGQLQVTVNVAPASGAPLASFFSIRSAPPTMKQAGPAFRLLAWASLGVCVVFP